MQQNESLADGSRSFDYGNFRGGNPDRGEAADAGVVRSKESRITMQIVLKLIIPMQSVLKFWADWRDRAEERQFILVDARASTGGGVKRGERRRDKPRRRGPCPHCSDMSYACNQRDAMQVEQTAAGHLFGAAPPQEERCWETYDHRPRFGTNYVGLRNRISVVSVGEAVILLHPLLSKVGLSIGMGRGCHQNGEQHRGSI